jgi:hypothetical protein
MVLCVVSDEIFLFIFYIIVLIIKLNILVNLNFINHVIKQFFEKLILIVYLFVMELVNEHNVRLVIEQKIPIVVRLFYFIWKKPFCFTVRYELNKDKCVHQEEICPLTNPNSFCSKDENQCLCKPSYYRSNNTCGK